jgi:PST family polysaccharide transporter
VRLKNIIRISILNLVSIFTRLFASLIINKYFAINFGTKSFGLIGNFQNLITIVLNFGNGGINSGVTKYTAEYEGRKKKQINIWITSLIISSFFSLFVFLFLFFFSDQFSKYIFFSKNYAFVFKWLAIFNFLCVINNTLLSILNGKKKFNYYIISNIVNSILSVIATFVLSYFWSINGALISLVINQSLSLLLTGYFFYKSEKFSDNLIIKLPPKKNYIRLLHFSLMSITTSVIGPLTYIFVRGLLKEKFSIEESGLWEGLNKMSNLQIMLLTSPLSMYYLPRFSELKDGILIKKEIFNLYKIIVPCLFLSAFFIYFNSDLLIKYIFSNEFLAIKKLLFFQLIGDAFRILIWINSYYFLSQRLTRLFVTSELLINLSFILLTYIFINIFSHQGVVIAYAINNFIFYLVFSMIILRKLK